MKKVYREPVPCTPPAKAENALTRPSMDPNILCCSATPGAVTLVEEISANSREHSIKALEVCLTVEREYIRRVARCDSLVSKECKHGKISTHIDH